MVTHQFQKLRIRFTSANIISCSARSRYRVLKDEMAVYTQEQIYALCRQTEGVEVLENIQPDHVHLILSIPPKYAVSNLMGYLKGKLALPLFNRYEQLGKRFWGRHRWSRGYCVSTIGLDEERIRQYVQWQEAREKYAEATQQRLFDDE